MRCFEYIVLNRPTKRFFAWRNHKMWLMSRNEDCQVDISSLWSECRRGPICRHTSPLIVCLSKIYRVLDVCLFNELHEVRFFRLHSHCTRYEFVWISKECVSVLWVFSWLYDRTWFTLVRGTCHKQGKTTNNETPVSALVLSSTRINIMSNRRDKATDTLTGAR